MRSQYALTCVSVAVAAVLAVIITCIRQAHGTWKMYGAWRQRARPRQPMHCPLRSCGGGELLRDALLMPVFKYAVRCGEEAVAGTRGGDVRKALLLLQCHAAPYTIVEVLLIEPHTHEKHYKQNTVYRLNSINDQAKLMAQRCRLLHIRHRADVMALM